MTPFRALLLTLATARLTRLVVWDEIGQWWIKDPIDRAAEQWWHDRMTEALQTADGHVGVREIEPEQPWWWKYRSGLDCPYCVGFWLGAGVLALDAAAGESPVWRLTRDALAMNMIVAPALSALESSREE